MATVTNSKYKNICLKCIGTNDGIARCEKCKNYYITNRICGCKFKKPPITSSVLEYNHDHTHKFFKHKKNDSIFFGIELEVEMARGQSIENIFDKVYKKKWVYFKHDGSVRRGIEIVTQPLSWQWIKNNEKEFDVIFDLANNHCLSRLTNTCGMHVHISKNIFSTLQLWKLLSFFKHNNLFINILSSRTQSNLDRWAKNRGEDNRLLINTAYKKNNSERHLDVNLANPSSIEIRIFKGTLSKINFFKNIEFTKALYDFTKKVNIQDAKNLHTFEELILNNKKEYPHLWEFMFNKTLLAIRSECVL